MVNTGGQGESYPQDQVDAKPRMHAPPMWELALHLFIIIIIKSSLSSFIHQRLISAIYNICRTFKFSCMIHIRLVKPTSKKLVQLVEECELSATDFA